MKQAWALAKRDFTLEWRGRTGLLSVLFFALVAMLTMGFAFGPDTNNLKTAAAGALWTTIAFAASLLGGRVFAPEIENHTLDELLLYPGSKEWVYVGKFLVQLCVLLAIALLALLLAGGLFYLPHPSHVGYLITIALGVVGLCTLSTFFAGMLVRLNQRGSLMPMLLLPLVIPVVLASTKATVAIAQTNLEDATQWWKLLLVFDVVELTACLMLFPLVLGGPNASKP